MLKLALLPFLFFRHSSGLLEADVMLAPPSAQETVDSQIAKGRKLLEEGKAVEAQVVFEAAEKQDGGTIKTRMWTLRSWLPQGRINDTLRELDALDKKQVKGPAMDYLYGMAFAFKARGYVKQGTGGSEIPLAFGDAVSFLQSATKADPHLYSDAFLYLADAAWQSQKLDIARPAAERAVGVASRDPEAWALLGRIALAQFVEKNADEAQKTTADAHWNTAFTAYGKVPALLGDNADPAAKSRLAGAHVDNARVLAWKQKFDEVAREYGLALGVDPTAVDLAEVHRVLPADKFVAALEAGSKAWAAAHAPDDKSDATMLWWLGFGRFEQKQYAGADEAFQAAVKKSPTFTNSWFYSALSRYHQQKYAEAIAAFRANFEASPADLVASIDGNREFNLPILDYLIGWCANPARAKLLDAAMLAEIESAVAPTWAPYQNNLGLFSRDAGDILARSKKPEDKAQAQQLWERALKAYEKAVALSPEDPNYLNDLGVVLHYNLHRDLDRAKTLYEKAAVCAAKELARTDLDANLRADRETAARDSKNNLEKLKLELEKKELQRKELENKDEPKKDG